MILLGAGLLLLAVAVVLLFAMMGEVSARVPASAGNENHVTPLETFYPGAAPTQWPGGLSELPVRERVVLLVLSPVCKTCSTVAATLRDLFESPSGREYGLVVSCSTYESGQEFLQRHSLLQAPHFVDEGGAWSGGTFGVNLSPSALVLEAGVLTDAVAFTETQSLLDHVGKAKTSQGVT